MYIFSTTSIYKKLLKYYKFYFCTLSTVRKFCTYAIKQVLKITILISLLSFFKSFKYFHIHIINIIQLAYKNNDVLSPETYTVGENPNTTLDITPTTNNTITKALLSVF